MLERQASHPWLAADERLCLRLNSAVRVGWVRMLFRAVSRLGDGVFWYVLMALLVATHGESALIPVAHMIGVGLAATLLYKGVKAGTRRPRPYQVNRAITRGGRALDRFSFPSGHTLHAVALTAVALSYYPALAALLVPFTVLVALSRMILGLHYPSDVAAGAAIGATLAAFSLAL